jgi:hypothetical protein
LFHRSKRKKSTDWSLYRSILWEDDQKPVKARDFDENFDAGADILGDVDWRRRVGVCCSAVG